MKGNQSQPFTDVKISKWPGKEKAEATKIFLSELMKASLLTAGKRPKQAVFSLFSFKSTNIGNIFHGTHFNTVLHIYYIQLLTCIGGLA